MRPTELDPLAGLTASLLRTAPCFQTQTLVNRDFLSPIRERAFLPRLATAHAHAKEEVEFAGGGRSTRCAMTPRAAGGGRLGPNCVLLSVGPSFASWGTSLKFSLVLAGAMGGVFGFVAIGHLVGGKWFRSACSRRSVGVFGFSCP